MHEAQRTDRTGAAGSGTVHGDWPPGGNVAAASGRLSPETSSRTTDDDLAPNDPSLTDDIAGLIDSGKTYAEAEIAFQKTRAVLAGRSAANAAGKLVGALILVHIALVALAVGLIIALAPQITIWGAIVVVVGAILLLVFVLVQSARNRAKQISALFAPSGGAK
jgi:hypothetical protein